MAAREDNGYWDALIRKDSNFDGKFVYAVRSTGVYCRPSCPSRRPHRNQVLFFTLWREAEGAGYRACRRCHPKNPFSTDPKSELVRKVCDYIEAHSDEPLTLKAISAEVGISPHYLQRTFKHVLGISPKKYAEAQRLDSFKVNARSGKDVTTSLYNAGYSSSSRLYENATAKLGMTPATYKKHGAGMEIDYSISESRFGFVLVAVTSVGICAVRLGDSAAELEKSFLQEYAEARIRKNDSGLKATVQLLLAQAEGRERNRSLPVDIQATAFQRRVWQELQKIPYGKTMSYSEVAEAIGRPKAARAVARACATNPAALAIPCHRVVSNDGSLGGYRWGIERKKLILNTEK